MDTREMNAYQEDFAALISMADQTRRIKLSGDLAEKKQQLLKELGAASTIYDSTNKTKPRKTRN